MVVCYNRTQYCLWLDLPPQLCSMSTPPIWEFPPLSSLLLVLSRFSISGSFFLLDIFHWSCQYFQRIFSKFWELLISIWFCQSQRPYDHWTGMLFSEWHIHILKGIGIGCSNVSKHRSNMLNSNYREWTDRQTGDGVNKRGLQATHRGGW